MDSGIYGTPHGIMHAACHVMTDLKFGSCTLLSCLPVIEASKLLRRGRESVSDSISAIKALASM